MNKSTEADRDEAWDRLKHIGIAMHSIDQIKPDKHLIKSAELADLKISLSALQKKIEDNYKKLMAEV